MEEGTGIHSRCLEETGVVMDLAVTVSCISQSKLIFVQLAYDDWKVKGLGLNVALLAQVNMAQLIKRGHF